MPIKPILPSLPSLPSQALDHATGGTHKSARGVQSALRAVERFIWPPLPHVGL